MASLTVRQLDDRLKKLLRLRAARHGRSMEDEVRVILRKRPRTQAAICSNARAAQSSRARQNVRVAGAAPSAFCSSSAAASRPTSRSISSAGCRTAALRVRCVLTAAAQQFVTPLAAGALERRARLHRSVRCAERIRRRPYPARARHRSHRGGAGDRRPDGEDGGRPRRRSRHRRAAGDRQADPDRAGHEPAHVGRQGDAAQSRAACRPTACASSAPTTARWRSAAKPASAAWPSRSEIAAAAEALLRPDGSALRQARAGHVGPDARADRSGALHRQPLLRQAGPCDRGAAAAAGADGDAGLRAGRAARSARRDRGEGRDRAADAGGGRKGAAGRCRGVRGRGRRLARRTRERQQDQESRKAGRSSSG